MEYENDNHIVEEVIEETPDTALDTTQEEITEDVPATTQEEDYIPVKYNKEEMKISRDEAPTYIQKGLNYDKVNQKASEYEQHLQKVAQITGYSSIDELIEAATQAEEQSRIQQESQRLGINEDAYRQHFEPVNSELQQLKTELQTLKQRERMQQIDAEINSLKSKYEDFSQYEKQVFDTAIEKGYNLEDAYKLVTYEDRIAKLARDKEQEVLAKVTGRDEKQVVSSNDRPSNNNFNPASMSFEEINELSRRARAGERITF